jgi:hypothetical protein
VGQRGVDGQESGLCRRLCLRTNTLEKSREYR